MALSNHPAPDWSRRTVLFPAVTGTILPVGFTAVAVLVLGVTPGVTHPACFPVASSHSCHTGVGADFALIPVSVNTPLVFLYTLSQIVS